MTQQFDAEVVQLVLKQGETICGTQRLGRSYLSKAGELIRCYARSIPQFVPSRAQSVFGKIQMIVADLKCVRNTSQSEVFKMAHELKLLSRLRSWDFLLHYLNISARALVLLIR